jgi:cytochrome P450 family 9
MYSMSAIHKDEKYFPNPLKFDPERFSEENIARMNPYVYQPFGSGPRICLGKCRITYCLQIAMNIKTQTDYV